jgi:hypothetical protein
MKAHLPDDKFPTAGLANHLSGVQNVICSTAWLNVVIGQFKSTVKTPSVMESRTGSCALFIDFSALTTALKRFVRNRYCEIDRGCFERADPRKQRWASAAPAQHAL